MFGFVSKRGYLDMQAQRDEARAQRDRLNERNSKLARELEEAGRVNGELQQRIRGFQSQLAEVERGYLAQLKDRDEALVAMRLQLDEATKTETPEVEYEVKQPEQEYVALPQNGKKPASKKRNTGRVSVKSASNTSGEDGAR